MHYNRMTRRHFLRGAGGFMLTMPVLTSLLPKAHAAGGAKAKRFIALWHDHGRIERQWMPTLQGADAGGYRMSRLSPSSGGISQILDGQLAPHFGRLLIPTGLDITAGGGHGAVRNFLGGGAGGSIDQIMRGSSAVYSGWTGPESLKSLHLFVPCWSNQSGKDKIAVGSGLNHYSNPLAAFCAVFGGEMPTADGSAQTPTPQGGSASVAAYRGAREKLVADRVHQELSALKSHARISAEDKMKIDQHMTFITDLQKDLQARYGGVTQPSTGTVGGKPAANVYGLVKNQWGQLSEPDVYKFDKQMMARDHVNVILAAMRADKTRVATLMLTEQDDDSKLDLFGGASGDAIHGLVHASSESACLSLSRAWLASYRHLLTEMKKIDEGDGRDMLYHSATLFGSQMADGALHNNSNVPLIVGGEAGGYFQTGRHLDYSMTSGKSHNRLLYAILESMGVNPASAVGGDGASRLPGLTG